MHLPRVADFLKLYVCDSYENLKYDFYSSDSFNTSDTLTLLTTAFFL